MWLHLLAVLVGLALGLWLMAEDNFDSLKGKRVLVTGASGGIGEQLALVYAEHGASVVVTARRQAELDKVVDKCRELSPANASHFAVTADMKDLDSIQQLVKNAVRLLGGLDIVVLNHITQSNIATFTGTHADLESVANTMDINFRSYVQTTSATLPHLTESRGGIVVVNSLMGSVPSPKLAGYVASKFALNGFFGSLRSQFVMERRNVAVTMCALGYIDTSTAQQGLRDSGSSRILRFVRPAPAQGAARAIAAASARRDDVMQYPGPTVRAFLGLNSLWPSMAELVVREMSRS